jgi:hypothetical protein
MGLEGGPRPALTLNALDWLILLLVLLAVAGVALVVIRRRRRGGGVFATRAKP